MASCCTYIKIYVPMCINPTSLSDGISAHSLALVSEAFSLVLEFAKLASASRLLNFCSLYRNCFSMFPMARFISSFNYHLLRSSPLLCLSQQLTTKQTLMLYSINFYHSLFYFSDIFWTAVFTL